MTNRQTMAIHQRPEATHPRQRQMPTSGQTLGRAAARPQTPTQEAQANNHETSAQQCPSPLATLALTPLGAPSLSSRPLSQVSEQSTRRLNMPKVVPVSRARPVARVQALPGEEEVVLIGTHPAEERTRRTVRRRRAEYARTQPATTADQDRQEMPINRTIDLTAEEVPTPDLLVQTPEPERNEPPTIGPTPDQVMFASTPRSADMDLDATQDMLDELELALG